MTTIRTREDVAAHVEAAMRLGAPGTVGAELEWLVVDLRSPGERPALERLHRPLGEGSGWASLPAGSLLSTEPGGQLELSSAPLTGPAAAAAALVHDLHAVRSCLAPGGLVLSGAGADPCRPPVRLVRSPRYEVMEAYYRRLGEPCASAGVAMMCSTAAAQVSLDAGTSGGGLQSAAARWRRAHAIGPALVAAFACSPLLGGAVTGWRSTRQRIWSQVDPSRTRAPHPGLGPVEATAALAVSAQLMTVRDAQGVCRPAPAGMTFGDWMTGGRVQEGDLRYHLTTLFPPVRLRAWFELRYLDMLPDPLWRVPLAVTAALLDDDRAADAANEACDPVRGRWLDAARLATGDQELASAALRCLLAAAEALPRMGATGLAAEVEAFAERYTARGRCPADDVLDAHAAGASPESLLLGHAAVAA